MEETHGSTLLFGAPSSRMMATASERPSSIVSFEHAAQMAAADDDGVAGLVLLPPADYTLIEESDVSDCETDGEYFGSRAGRVRPISSSVVAAGDSSDDDIVHTSNTSDDTDYEDGEVKYFPVAMPPTADLVDVPTGASARGMCSRKQLEFLLKNRQLQDAGDSEAVETPFVLMDLDIVRRNYLAMRRYLPEGVVHYAVKANPDPEIVDLLQGLGSHFDVASRGEISLCLAHGVPADKISFGNTIKKEKEIRFAYEKGVRLFVFDSLQELHKVARQAPGALVYCRILAECPGAEWPLSRKFGCDPRMAEQLLVSAQSLGLVPYGVSFHVGSQQTNLASWDTALSIVGGMFRRLAKRGVHLKMVNIGGGYPAHYQHDVAGIEAYTNATCAALYKHLGHVEDLRVFVEPGRSLVGDAGVLETEVVLVSRKSPADAKTWVYLDVGTYSGLSEVLGESIKYKLMIPSERQGPMMPVTIAGPSCDSADILYERTAYYLPADLSIGDKLLILSTGAYTTQTSSVGFNGFAALKSVCI